MWGTPPPPRRAWEEGPLGPSLLSWPPSILQVHCGVTAAVSSADTLSSLSGSDDILGSFVPYQRD